MYTRRARLLFWFLLAPALFVLLAAPSSQVSHPPYQSTGPASDTINFRAFAVEIAAKELEAGTMDMYLFSLKTASAAKLKANPDATVYEAPASTVSIVLNPAPAPEGDLNPLSIKEVRQALQHAVNRPFIAQEIYKGLALPMITQVSPSDFDYLTVYDLLKDGHLAGAAVDVFERDPYRGPLKDLDNVILTPHIGSYARESRSQMEIDTVKNLIDALKG